METNQKKNKKLFIIIGAIVILCVLAVAIIVATGSSSGKKLSEQLNLGEKYLSELDYESAIAAYEAAIKIDPKAEDAYLGLAEVYVAMGDMDKALEVLQTGYEETGSEQIADKSEEIKQDTENNGENSTGADNADVGEAGNGEVGSGEAGTDESATASEDQNEEIQISLEEFLYAPTAIGKSWMDCGIDELADYYGLGEENDYTDIIGEDGDDISNWVEFYGVGQVWDIEDDTDCEVIFYVGDSGYGYTAYYGEPAESGDGTIGFLDYKIDTAAKWYRPESYASDISKIQGYSDYLQKYQCYNVEEILAAWGMEEVDPAMMEAARNHQDYEATYVTEYGEAVFQLNYHESHLSMKMREDQTEWYEYFQPQTWLSIEFKDETSPFGGVYVQTTYDDGFIRTPENPDTNVYDGTHTPQTFTISVGRNR